MVSRSKSIKKEFGWLLFVIPALIFYLGFFILPSVSSIYYSLTDWDGVTSKFIGLANYKELFQDKMIWTSFGNTAMYSAFIIVFQNIIGLILALLLVRKFKSANILRTMFFMPYIFSTLLIGYVWGFILEPNIGVVNTVLDKLGLQAFEMGWLSDPFWARWMIILITVWWASGYTMVINIAGLKAIPMELYEASDIDGAKRFGKFIHITFPLLAPAFTINIMLSLIGTLQIFNQVYALTNGGPGYSTHSVASMIYELGFGSSSRWGYGAAMSIVLFLCILIISIFSVTILRKREVEM